VDNEFQGQTHREEGYFTAKAAVLRAMLFGLPLFAILSPERNFVGRLIESSDAGS
jgi:hypothetical protein